MGINQLTGEEKLHALKPSGQTGHVDTVSQLRYHAQSAINQNPPRSRNLPKYLDLVRPAGPARQDGQQSS